MILCERDELAFHVIKLFVEFVDLINSTLGKPVVASIVDKVETLYPDVQVILQDNHLHQTDALIEVASVDEIVEHHQGTKVVLGFEDQKTSVLREEIK